MTMTIFLELAKQYLIPKIEEIHKASVKADLSLLNSIRGFFHVERNSELSNIKQELILGLIKEIKDLENQTNDAATCAHIKIIIANCLDDMSKARKEKNNYPEGETEKSIRKLDTLIDFIFKKLSNLQVLDIPHDKDPLNCFRHYIALYCTHKIIEEQNENPSQAINIIQAIIKDPHLSKSRMLAKIKDDIIMGVMEDKTPSIIQLCMDELAALKPKMDTLAQKRNTIVIQFMNQFQNQNLELYRKNGIDIGVPPQCDFAPPPLTEIKNGGGFLGECLRRATVEIQVNMNPLADMTEEEYIAGASQS